MPRSPAFRVERRTPFEGKWCLNMLKKLFLVFFLLLFIAAGVAYYLYGEVLAMLEPVDPGGADEVQVVEIPPGANTDIIGLLLEDSGLIHDARVFRLYVHHHDLGRGFIAGHYELDPAMSMEEIIGKLQSGDVYRTTTWFTVQEGLKIEEVAERLDGQGLVSREKFLELAYRAPRSFLEKYPYLEDFDPATVDYQLEGYLFPDTYEIYAGAGEEEVMAIMLRRLDGFYTEENLEKARALGLTWHEALTLASIVEREARVDGERPLIAGVFLNRLADGWLLESCATVQYALGETRERLLYEDLEVDSPYNTYLNPGLPPGPIAASGEASILAVLNPEDSDYYFFNTREDGSGEHYFSKTLAEHNANVRRSRENRPQ